MKKLKYLILALALIPNVLFAYTVQQGDTPYELWGADWKTELSKYGIQDPRRLPVGLEVDLEDDLFGAIILPEDSYDTFLTAPLSSSATEVFVNVAPSFVSSSIYTLFASDGRTVREKLYCTGTSASPNKLTGCVRGLSEGPVSGVIDETAGTGVSHSRNARIAITDNINFSGKALAILGGNQETGANNFDVGTASSTDGNKCFRFDTGDTDTQICANDGTGELYWTTDGGSNTYLFTSSTISQLTASSTAGIGVTNSEIYINASSTTGMGFDSNGALYQSIGNALEYTNNAIGVSTSTIVEQIATSTPTANSIPLADGNGAIDSGWLSEQAQSAFRTETLTAGEDLTNGNAVRIGNSAQSGDVPTPIVNQTTTSTEAQFNGFDFRAAQSFTTGDVDVNLYSATFRINADTANTIGFQVRLYSDNSGEPGAVIATDDTSAAFSTNETKNVEFVFSAVQLLSANTVYWLSIEGQSNFGTNTFVLYKNTDVYAGGNKAVTTNDASTWTSQATEDLYLVTTMRDVSGRVYKATAASQAVADLTLGFANGTYSGGDTNVSIDHYGLVSTQTGLSTGVLYYLSDTRGALSTSAGSASRKMGLAFSSTTLYSMLGF